MFVVVFPLRIRILLSRSLSSVIMIRKKIRIRESMIAERIIEDSKLQNQSNFYLAFYKCVWERKRKEREKEHYIIDSSNLSAFPGKSCHDFTTYMHDWDVFNGSQWEFAMKTEHSNSSLLHDWDTTKQTKRCKRKTGQQVGEGVCWREGGVQTFRSDKGRQAYKH